MRASEFDGKTAYVVGGSMGIGLATATLLASLGAHVGIFARRREPLEAALAAVERQRRHDNQRCWYRQLDVRDFAQVAAVANAAVAEFGPPDVLINCAGRAYPDYFENISPDQFADTMQVNLGGCWNTVSALVPHMRGRGAYIVNTSSLAGLIGIFGYTDYCASKFAVVGFSEALRSELAPRGITVSVLCPPDTQTPGFATENRTKPAETHAISAGAKVMNPDAVARALIAGMGKKKFLIIPGADGRFAALAQRLAPGVVRWLTDRQVRRVAGARRR